jgi:hypothetical protein
MRFWPQFSTRWQETTALSDVRNALSRERLPEPHNKTNKKI